MSLDINVWRCRIGIFSGNNSKVIQKRSFLGSYNTNLFYKLFLFLLILQLKVSFTGSIYLFFTWSLSKDLIILIFFQHFLAAMLLLRCGDILPNPGPKSKDFLSVCHFNIQSIPSHNFAKLSSLEAFNSVHNFDIICISESFLDSTFSSDSPDLALKNYRLARADHPLDIKRGGTCIYYKEILPIKVSNIINLQECLLCEISFNNQKCLIVSLYRSPSQSANEFQSFLKELEILIMSICTPGDSNLVIIVGDFNAKLSTWNPTDSDSIEGIELSAMTSS